MKMVYSLKYHLSVASTYCYIFKDREAMCDMLGYDSNNVGAFMCDLIVCFVVKKKKKR